MSVRYVATTTNHLAAPFGKDPRMRVHSVTPLNLEASLEVLGHAITPIEHCFLRNNHAMPAIAPAEWALTIGGHVERPYTLSYAELRELKLSELPTRQERA